MKTFAIVPVKRFENSKTRLSSVLDMDDRIRLSSLMLEDTVKILLSVPLLTRIVIVSPDKRAEELARKYGVSFLMEEKEKGVNFAVALAENYCISEAAEATVVIPQDLPLLEPIEVFKACQLAQNESRCIVICPSLRYDGTNMLLRKPPSVISTFYDADSYNMHVKAAIKLGIPVKRLFSRRVMYDIDTPGDALQLTKEEAVAARSLEFIKSKF